MGSPREVYLSPLRTCIHRPTRGASLDRPHLDPFTFGGVVSCHRPSGPRSSTLAHMSESTTDCQKTARLPTFPTRLFVSILRPFVSALEQSPTAALVRLKCGASDPRRLYGNCWTLTPISRSFSKSATATRSEITCNTSDLRTKSASSEPPAHRQERSDRTPAGTSLDAASTLNVNTVRRSEVHSKTIANPIASAIANALAKPCECDSNVSVSVIASVSGSLPKSVCLSLRPIPIRLVSDAPIPERWGWEC